MDGGAAEDGFLRYALRTTVSTGERAFTWKRVRGSSRPGIAEIIMTAVDQAGNKVARYRIIGPGFFGRPVEIIVHPDQQLTNELVLAIVISAPWLLSYFPDSGGGG